MKHSHVIRRFLSQLACAGLIFSLALGPALSQARGKAAPQPPVPTKFAHRHKPVLPAKLKPGHLQHDHHVVERGPVKLNVAKYPSGPQKTIQGFRQQ